MRLLTYILVILLLLPVKAKGEGADTPVENLYFFIKLNKMSVVING